MELFYENFDICNIDEEIENIENSDLVNIKVSTSDKGLLFLLGVLFAMGKKIRIINKEELDLSSNGKSFYIMSYVWEKLGDDNFPSNYSNITSDLDILITNVKTLGLRNQPIENNSIYNRFFLISPVRNATDEQKNEMNNYVQNKKEHGWTVHLPKDNTFQKDKLGGYAICHQNASAIGDSSEIHIYYDQTSNGTMFDLGVAYYFKKDLIVINEDKIVYNENDFGDNVVKNWNKKNIYTLKKLY